MIELIYSVIIASVICTFLLVILSLIQKRWHIFSAKIHNISIKYLILFMLLPILLITFSSVRSYTDYIVENVASPYSPDITTTYTYDIGSIIFSKEDRLTQYLSIILIIWIIGMLVSLCKLIRTKMTIKDISMEFTESNDLNNRLNNITSKLNYTNKVTVCTSEMILTPCITAIGKPVILFPYDYSEYSDEEIDFLLKHEVNHWLNKDLLFLKILNIIKIIHWFNPFIKLLDTSFRLSAELTSDEMIVSNLNREKTVQYGSLLMKSADKHTDISENVSLGFMLNEDEILLERIKHLKKHKGSKLKVMLSVLITIVFMLSVPITIYAGSETINKLVAKSYEMTGEEIYIPDVEENIVAVESLDSSLYTVYSGEVKTIESGVNGFLETLQYSTMYKALTYTFEESIFIFLTSSSSSEFMTYACPAGEMIDCVAVYSDSTDSIDYTISLNGSYDIWIINTSNSLNIISGSITTK